MNAEKNLKIGLILTLIFFIVELLGGLISGSLSLLADAGHMFRDAFALFASLAAINIAKKLPTETKTFGYHRTEIFAALANGIFLLVIGGWVVFEAFLRFSSPKPIESGIMFGTALIGLMVNLYVASRLKGSKDLNIKSAFWHVLTDALSSIAVVAGSVWIFFTGQIIIDPILGLMIGAFILLGSFSVIREAVCVLLQFAPKCMNLNEIIKEIENVEGVEDVHHVHLWSLCSNINILDCHVQTDARDMKKVERIKRKIKESLKKFNIRYATLEFECKKCGQKANHIH